MTAKMTKRGKKQTVQMMPFVKVLFHPPVVVTPDETIEVSVSVRIL